MVHRLTIAALLIVGVTGAAATVAYGTGSSVDLEAFHSGSCVDDANYQTLVEQTPVDGGTRVTIRETVRTAAPTLSADATGEGLLPSSKATLAITSTDDHESSTCDRAYEAVVTVPSTDFRLVVLHDGTERTVVTSAGNHSGAESSSSNASAGT